ncbi:MAG: hypothetical protein OXC11_14110 [Rhodospirillales bacterium]|nr:hypothetical protein [Rhodospirillales bacterium]
MRFIILAGVAGLTLWANAAIAMTLEEKIESAKVELRELVCDFRKVANDPDATADQATKASLKLQAGGAEVERRYGRAVAQAAAYSLSSEGDAACQQGDTSAATTTALAERIESARAELRELVCDFRKVADDPDATADQATKASLKLQAGGTEVERRYGRTVAQAAAYSLSSEGDAACQGDDASK